MKWLVTEEKTNGKWCIEKAVEILSEDLEGAVFLWFKARKPHMDPTWQKKEVAVFGSGDGKTSGPAVFLVSTEMGCAAARRTL